MSYINERKEFVARVGLRVIVFSCEFTITQITKNGLWVANEAVALRKELFFIENRFIEKSVHLNTDRQKKRVRTGEFQQ